MMFGGEKLEANISFLYFWLGGLVRKLGEGNVKFVWGAEVVLIFEVIFIFEVVSIFEVVFIFESVLIF